MFIAIDGDDVGIGLRTEIIANRTSGVTNFSNQLVAYFKQIEAWLLANHVNIVFRGGDSILAECDDDAVEDIAPNVPRGICTVSIGLGATAEQAYLALQLAKARGKAQTVVIEVTRAETIAFNNMDEN